MRDLSAEQGAVLRYVQEHPGTTTADAARGLGWAYNQADRRLSTLYVARRLRRYNNPRTFAGATWFPEGVPL